MTKQIILLIATVGVLFTNCTSKSDESSIQNRPDSLWSNNWDGPYIFHEDNQWVSYGINGQNEFYSEKVKVETPIRVVAPKQKPDHFIFCLSQRYTIPEAVTQTSEKIFAMSDLEGNYYALVQLLKGNSIVDEELNWKYGKNHLVIVGDMVDRGEYVSQVLWLFYKLDKQAQEAGGQVHIILGNHDVMCMEGDNRYAQEKYMEMAKRLEIPYKELYGPQSAIGRWMRSKNSIEKVGGYLFVHAGFSPEVLALDYSLEDINSKVRPYLGKDITNDMPEEVQLLFGSWGVFWYRGFLKAREGKYEKAPMTHINNVLARYSAKGIVIGHSIVEHVSSAYQGKVIRVDVHHPDSAHSEYQAQGLLIDKGKLYRVDAQANRTQIGN